eukprot:11222209-Lingulodinium_polyedra.AAC.1
MQPSAGGVARHPGHLRRRAGGNQGLAGGDHLCRGRGPRGVRDLRRSGSSVPRQGQPASMGPPR